MLQLHFDPFPILNTSRLNLRKITHSDVNEIFFLRSDSRVLAFLQRDPAKTLKDATEFINNIKDSLKTNEAIMWAICVNPDPKLVGTICLWHIEMQHHRAEIGYVILPDYQGIGYMHEATDKVLEYGFEIMKLHSIEANVDPANKSSIRLLEKNHFVREGYFLEHIYYNGKYFDSAIYSLLNHREIADQ